MCVFTPHSRQAKLDVPAWGKAAQALSSVAEEAAQFQKLNEECDAGDNTACDALSKEEEAKLAWLAKIDVPSWGKAAAAMKEIGEEQVAASMPSMSEEEAKQKWLAKLCVVSRPRCHDLIPRLAPYIRFPHADPDAPALPTLSSAVTSQACGARQRRQ